ncbi:regulatory protein [Bordetella ansorpii]|uniref:Regulatory protein n=1 Tax=Bordetella ansorpii TaxID=288768 RepID=A0A157SH81_9BORD|nr:DMT family transporter [Bordetella ansorpii]SAI69296.1 regulatory protein [Bordetella ansorpii]
MGKDLDALAAAAAVGTLVGAAMVLTRMVSPDVPPATLAFLRYLIGVLVLLLPLHRARFPSYAPRDAVGIAVLGIFQFAILILLLNHALISVPATTCALVFSTMPLMTMCLAVMARRERFDAWRSAGIAMAFGGVAYLLLAAPAAAGTVRGAGFGIAAAVGATVIGASTSLLYRPYLRRYPALATCRLAMLAAVLFLSAYCLAVSEPLMPALTPPQWLAVGFIGVSSGVGYFCWLWALAKLEASKVAAFQALGPVTAAVLEALLGKRLPAAEVMLALALVCLGLFLATRSRALP